MVHVVSPVRSSGRNDGGEPCTLPSISVASLYLDKLGC